MIPLHVLPIGHIAMRFGRDLTPGPLASAPLHFVSGKLKVEFMGLRRYPLLTQENNYAARSGC